jgi:hypothetical protein
MSKPKYYDEYGCEFDGPFGVSTFMGDDVTSYPDEAAARKAALEACTRDDHTTTVYGPKIGTLRARKVATYRWSDDGPYEV